jgi:adenylate cyclase
MTIRPAIRRKLFSMLGTIAGWMVAAFFGIWVIAETPLDLDHFLVAIIGGACAGLATYLVDNSSKLKQMGRHMSAFKIVMLRTTHYKLVIILLILLVMMVRAPIISDVGPIEFFTDDAFLDFILSGDFTLLLVLLLAASFIISFVREVHRMFGPGTFLKLFLGTYVNPTEEDRVVMFLDLNNSTAIAERLGPLKFTDFKNDFFRDLADPVLETDGEIFQYVGDEVVLTWKSRKGLRDANWLRFFFMLKDAVASRAEQYIEEYGVVPDFKAGVHAGTVITTEIGELKREIVYSGDVMNTASRIETVCRPQNKSLLVSDALVQRTSIPSEFDAEEIGPVDLRGKSEVVDLWSITRTNGRIHH